MSDLGETYRAPAVRFERRLPGSTASVWAHLTDCAKLTGWYGDDSRIEPREGGAVRLMGGHIRGVVTQWRPGSRLAHTWNVFSPGEERSPYPESYLTIDLEPEADGVRLVLTHLPVLDRFETQNAMGWHTFLDILEATLAGRPVEPRPAYMQRNAARYGVDLANLQR
ncbi:MAG TPA: SRPBCC domain-containing protein [Caulobacteraceae bacterium]|nr:SRPBCC domain-containing protein [Caulobacteraceae bacterium]